MESVAGARGRRRAILEWTATWEDLEMHVERYIGVGDDRVVVLWNERGRGKRSGVSLSQAGVTVCTLRDGAIVGMRVAVDRHGTLRAMGLQSE